jgi:hypothetical protein
MPARKKQPAAKKPATKQPAAKKRVAKKSVAKKPAAKKRVAKKSVAKKPVAKKSTVQRKAAPPARGDELMWSIVERAMQASGGELAAACDAFRTELDRLDDDQLVRVEAAFCFAMRRAYDWNVWGAAYVILGGCSDDSFWDFRAGLISLGREVYEAALRDPESLAAVDDVENKTLMEGFQYVPGKLLEERGLESMGGGHGTGGPAGKSWTENLLKDKYPKLTARFG